MILFCVGGHCASPLLDCEKLNLEDERLVGANAALLEALSTVGPVRLDRDSRLLANAHGEQRLVPTTNQLYPQMHEWPDEQKIITMTDLADANLDIKRRVFLASDVLEDLSGALASALEANQRNDDEQRSDRGSIKSTNRIETVSFFLG